MKSLFLFLLLFLCSRPGYCERIDSLIEAISTKPSSWKDVQQAILRFSSNGNNNSLEIAGGNKKVSFYTDPTFLDAEIYTDSYRSEGNDKKTTGDIRVVFIKNRVLYVSITCNAEYINKSRKERNDTLYRYINDVWLTKVLSPHNKKYGINYTWQELFEDHVTVFTDGLGMLSMSYYDYDESYSQMMRFVVEKNFETIRKLRYSLNPTRQAYAAVALSIMRHEGVLLPREENEWLNGMRRSDLKVLTQYGCLRSTEKISSLIADETIKGHVEDKQRWESHQKKKQD